MAFICPCYALVELSSFLFVLILLGYILVDVFVPTILARDLAIVLQLFFFAVSLFSVTSPFRTCSFPLHGLMEFYILACRFSATPGAYFALLYHRSKFFLKGHSSLSVAWVLFPPLFLTLGLAIVNTL